jgi:sulfite exporter TauE/SafE
MDGAGWGFMSGFICRASGQATARAFLLAGLVMGLLPCGLVYGVLIIAATGGSLLQGGGMMLAFGLGTLPALLTYGQVATAISAIANTLFLRIMGLLVALLGGWGLLQTLVRMELIRPFHIW